MKYWNFINVSNVLYVQNLSYSIFFKKKLHKINYYIFFIYKWITPKISWKKKKKYFCSNLIYKLEQINILFTKSLSFILYLLWRFWLSLKRKYAGIFLDLTIIQ